MKQRADHRWRTPLAVFAALLVLWQLILWVFRVPPYMLPSPWAVARAVGPALPFPADFARPSRRKNPPAACSPASWSA